MREILKKVIFLFLSKLLNFFNIASMQSRLYWSDVETTLTAFNVRKLVTVMKQNSAIENVDA